MLTFLVQRASQKLQGLWGPLTGPYWDFWEPYATLLLGPYAVCRDAHPLKANDAFKFSQIFQKTLGFTCQKFW